MGQRMELLRRLECLLRRASGWSCCLVLVVELLPCCQCGAAPQGLRSSSFGTSLHPKGSMGVVPLCSPGVAELQVPAASV